MEEEQYKQRNIMSLKGITHNVLDEFGYHSVADLGYAIFHFKAPLFGLLIATILTTLEAIINKYVYTPSEGILILVGATLLDIIFGVIKAVKKKREDPVNNPGIQATRFSRALIRVVVQVMFVGLFYQMSLIWTHIITSWMVDALLILFTLTVAWSALKNAKDIGMITNEQYEVLEGIVGLRKILDKFKKKS